MKLLPSALRSRLALLFAGAVVVVIALAVALLALGVDHQFDNAIDAGLSTRAAALTTALGRADETAVKGDALAEVVRPDGASVVRSTALDLVPGSAALLTAEQRREAYARGTGSPLSIDRRVPSLQQVPALHGWVRLRAARVELPTGSAVLVVGSRLDPIYDAEGRLLLLFVLGAPPLVLLLGLAGWLLAGAALRPVAALTARAAQISAADTDLRLPQPPGTDEVAELARTLNRMLARVDAGVRREREFVDDAAHELRTPIAVLRGELELALLTGRRSGDLSADVEESLVSALAESERLGRLAQDLLVLATLERSAHPTDRVELLALARTEVARLAAVHAVRVEVVGEAVEVLADGRDLGRLLANLVANAEAAGARRARVLVGPARDLAPALESAAVVRVDDDGPGFPPSLLATATERFTRADPARTRGGSGAGLGLAIVSAVATAHGGGVVLTNGGELGGASVRVHLPALAPAVAPAARAQRPPAGASTP